MPYSPHEQVEGIVSRTVTPIETLAEVIEDDETLHTDALLQNRRHGK